MKKIRLLAILNILSLGIHLTLVWLTQQKMINDSDVAEISNQFPSLFTPAGITFAIWGLIYLLLILFCGYHLVMSWRQPATHQANRDTLGIGALFVINSLVTAAWLYYWTHAWLLASLMLIIIQWLTLAGMHGRLGIYDRDAGAGSKIFTQLPLSIYFGWITVATIANTASFLTSIGWDGMGISMIHWTMIMIGTAVLIGLFMIFARRNVFFGLVLIWALGGIIVKHTAPGAAPYPDIVLAAEIGIIVTGLACVLQLAKNISFQKTYRDRHYPLFPEARQPVK